MSAKKTSKKSGGGRKALSCPSCGRRTGLVAMPDGYSFGGQMYHEVRCGGCRYSWGLSASAVKAAAGLPTAEVKGS